MWEGLAILNALRAHSARVVAVVEGIAASAASFIAAGVDELVMMKNSELFIHNAWGIAIGNAETMTKTAEDLAHIDGNLAAIYAEKAGTPAEQWLALMGDDTYLSAEEAVEAGLADRVEGVGDAAAARARFDLSQLSARAPRVEPTVPASEPGATNRKENVVARDDSNADTRDRLGTTETETEQPAAEATAQPTAEAPAAPAAAAQTTTVTIDRGQFEELQANARSGAEALAELNKQRRDGLVAQALQDGRISPSTSDTWRAQLDENEKATAALLEVLPKNTIPVLETGHTVETSAEDAAYNRVYGPTEKGA